MLGASNSPVTWSNVERVERVSIASRREQRHITRGLDAAHTYVTHGMTACRSASPGACLRESREGWGGSSGKYW